LPLLMGESVLDAGSPAPPAIAETVVAVKDFG
jgi:hypothetical protein